MRRTPFISGPGHLLRALALGILVVAGGLAARCEAPDLLPPDRNRPPETRLTRGPDSLDVAYYRVHLYWSGYDVDGTVSLWQYAIDDTVVRPDAEIVGTGWLRTTKSDSLFIFSASTNGTDQQREHLFFVSSIDNEGKPDPSPSILHFDARTVAYPEPDVVSGPAEGETLDVFSTVTICWGGIDPDGEIVSMSFRLDPIESQPTSKSLAEQSCKTYESLPSNGSRENYRFLLRAEDDAGSINPISVERRFVVNHDPNTTITRFYSVHASGRADLASQSISEGDTIADSSRAFFAWDATDVDGAIKGAYWRVEGIQQDTTRSNEGLLDSALVRESSFKWLTSNVGPARLIVGSVDEYGRAEGSPDTIKFVVNYPPSVTITKPSRTSISVPNNLMTVAWRGADRDGEPRSIEYIVEVGRQDQPAESRRIEAGRADSTAFTVTRGTYDIHVTPTDRRGELNAKVGKTAVLTVVVTSSATDPLSKEEEQEP